MYRFLSKTLVIVIPAFALPLAAVPRAGAGEVAHGHWLLTRFRGAPEVNACLVKLESKDGKLPVEFLASAPRVKNKPKNISLDGKVLRITLTGPVGDETFEAQLGGKNPKAIAGSLSNENQASPARLTATDLTTLQAGDLARSLQIAAMEKADKILGDT